MQWDNVEDKTSVVVYGVGAVVVLWLSTSLVSAINSLPLVCIAHAELKSTCAQDQLACALPLQAPWIVRPSIVLVACVVCTARCCFACKQMLLSNNKETEYWSMLSGCGLPCCAFSFQSLRHFMSRVSHSAGCTLKLCPKVPVIALRCSHL